MNTKKTFHSCDDLSFVQVAATELTPLMIDWLVARLEGVQVGYDGTSLRTEDEHLVYGGTYSPSTDPALGHVLLEREKIQCRYIDSPGHKFHGLWFAQDCIFRPTEQSVGWSPYGTTYPDLHLGYLTGPTMLVAGLKFIIAKSMAGKTPLPEVCVPAQLAPAKLKRTGKKLLPLMLKRIAAAHRLEVGLHFTPGEVELLALGIITDVDADVTTPVPSACDVTTAASHEERFELMSKRLRVAYKAGLGLECSRIELRMLGMTSLVKSTARAQPSSE